MTLLYCNTFGPNIEQKYHCFVLVIIIEICLLGRTYGVKLVLLLVQILNKSTSTLFNDNNQLKDKKVRHQKFKMWRHFSLVLIAMTLCPPYWLP